MSMRRATALRERGTTRSTIASAIRPTMALTANTERQPNASVSAPPTIGPRPVPSPDEMPQRPIARARSRGSG